MRISRRTNRSYKSIDYNIGGILYKVSQNEHGFFKYKKIGKFANNPEIAKWIVKAEKLSDDKVPYISNQVAQSKHHGNMLYKKKYIVKKIK